MASRRHAPSDVSDRYEPRRGYGRSDVGRRDERIWEDELEYRPRPAPRDRHKATVVKEEVRVKERSPPEFLREDYGRTSAGPVVLRAREREDYEFVPRRRSPSPEPERKVEREEIIVRREPEPRREPPPPPRNYDHEEIIVRRAEREPERIRAPPPREVERDEYIIRREERGGNPRYSSVYERDDHLDRRPPPSRDDYERDEIIIRRERDESRDAPRYRGRDDTYPLPRAVSHERERSRMGRSRAGSDTDEIIIRRDEREAGRNGREREREEIIIRRHDSRSSSPASTRAPSVRPPPEPQVINAPAIHQEVITHHRHIDHGFELALAPAPPPVRERPPSPPTPPREEDERIEIHRRGERNGRAYHEDIIIDRDQTRSAPPIHDRREEEFHRHSYYDDPGPLRRPAPPPERWRDPRDSRDIQEEADYYNQRALERSYPGEGYHGSTRDWAIVDVPPGTRRVRMDGAGGGAQEITWQRYNGVRRSKFWPDGSDEGYGSEVGRPVPAPAPTAGGDIGRRYAGAHDAKEGLWTEITKDLVVKDAIKEAGYEFEETDDFFYIIAYLKYVSFTFLFRSPGRNRA